MTRPSMALTRLSHVHLPTLRRADELMAMPALDLTDRRRRWTAREVRELIAASPLATPRYELVDGELLVTPSPGYAHQRAVGELLVALAEHLRTEGIGEAITSPM